MDPKLIGYIVFVLLVFPGFLSHLRGQVKDIRIMLSDIGSDRIIYDLGLTAYRQMPEPLLLAELHTGEEMDCSLHGRLTPGEPYASHYNPSMLLMVSGLLSKKEVLLDYCPSDTLIRVMAVTNESSRLYTFPVPPGFWKVLKQFLRHIRMADLVDYRQQSQCLTRLFLGAISGELKGKSKVIIIPRERLAGFPFEILIQPDKDGTSSARRKLLVESYEIVYNNSLEQWLGSRIRNLFVKTRAGAGNSLAFAGFSPGFEYDECIQFLPNAGSEISRIGEMFRENGKTPLVLLCENSNENTFRQIAPFSDILHIATHSITSPELPEMNGLLFSEFASDRENGYTDDGLLAVKDICNMKIPAELIVLDACASANLRTRIGLNWFSCVDCFMKAGARNILCTLWNVSDRFAEPFMVDFYRNYLSGMSFSKALQQVKLHMIQEPSTSLPVNWAAYVLIGE
ncbi:MAG: CHAT domain-containing protein [Bacteroidota bacterium]